MIDAISKFFEDKMGDQAAGMDEERQLQVATCVLLLEVAHADEEVTAEERDTIDSVVARRFGLDREQTRALLDHADQERRQEEDLYGFSRLLNQTYSRPRKLAILDLLWEVVFSDGVMQEKEDALMHKMGTLLGVRHTELMAVKVQVKKRLADS